ncbi:MAG TPA: hypothetical protein PLJ00_16210 [Chitinophagales bacterium]|nr:hypothetical protein [Chitinophagales bacterium]
MEENNKLTVSKTNAIDSLIQSANTLPEMQEIGKAILLSGFAPDHFKKDNDAMGCIIAIATGHKLGLDMLQSLNNIVPIKGVPTLKGDLIRSLIKNSPECEKWDEFYEGTPFEDDYCHVIVMKRRGYNEKTRKFSVEMAKRAGLFITAEDVTKNKEAIRKWYDNKDNNSKSKYPPGDISKSGWYRYPDRMLMYRNIGFAGRDEFGDILMNLKSYEEIKDFTENTTVEAEYQVVDDAPAAQTTTKKAAATKKVAEKAEKPVVEVAPVPVEEVPVETETVVEEVKPEIAEEKQPEEKEEIAVPAWVSGFLNANSPRPLFECAAFVTNLSSMFPQQFESPNKVYDFLKDQGVAEPKTFVKTAALQEITKYFAHLQ